MTVETKYLRLTEGATFTRLGDRTANAIATTGRGWRELAREIEPPAEATDPAAQAARRAAAALRQVAQLRPHPGVDEHLEAFNVLLPLANLVYDPYGGHEMADVAVPAVVLLVPDAALRRLLHEVTADSDKEATSLSATTALDPHGDIPFTLRRVPQVTVHADYAPGTRQVQYARLECSAWTANVPMPGWKAVRYDTETDDLTTDASTYTWFDFIDMARCFARFGHVQ